MRRLLAIGLAGALVGLLAGCRRPALDPLAYLPAESNVVVRLDLAGLRSTPTATQALGWKVGGVPLRDQITALAKATGGFDPSRDLDVAVAGLAWTPGGAPGGGAVLRGRFAPRGLVRWVEARARERGHRLETGRHAGETVYRIPGRLALSFLGEHTVLVGTGDWVPRMLERAQGRGDDLRRRPEMAPALAHLRRPATISVAGSFPARPPSAGGGPLAGLRGGHGSLDLRERLVLDLRLECQDEAQAAAMRASVRDGVATVRRFLEDFKKTRLAHLVQSVMPHVSGATLQVNAELTPEQSTEVLTVVGAILDKLLGQPGEPGQRPSP